MTFPTYRLPPSVEQGARGGPEFKTIIQEAVSGKEQRILQWARARAKYDIAYGLRESDDPVGNFRGILALFYAHLGQLYPFPFKDWSDYQATADFFGTGDGVETQFQLGKLYDPSLILLNVAGSTTYLRPIYLIVGTPIIYVDGVPTVAFTLSSSGLITFDSPPANNKHLRWTGEFDIPVRFDTDHLPVIMNANDLMQIDSIPIREVLGEV